jgi:hypothetical protein
MEHTVIRYKLSEYIDGFVTADEKAEIEAHLKTCTICGDALRELRKVVEYIKAVEEIEPPIWMTQKTMSKIRVTEEKRQAFFHRLYFKLPIQAVAVLFLAVAAFYIYRSVQPTVRFEDMPRQQFLLGNKAAVPTRKSLEPSPANRTNSEISKAKDSSASTTRVPQTPEYRALDMRQEYESPPAPVLEGRASVPAQAPTKSTEQVAPTRESKGLERRAAALQAPAPATLQEQAESAAGASQQAASKHEAVLPKQETKGFLDGKEGRSDFEKVIIGRYPNGRPKLVISYKLISSNKVRVAEEKFNKDGERHGVQKEYYGSGQVKTEARYENGKLDWYVEFYPDGVKKTGKSDFDWFWLKN